MTDRHVAPGLDEAREQAEFEYGAGIEWREIAPGAEGDEVVRRELSGPHGSEE